MISLPSQKSLNFRTFAMLKVQDEQNLPKLWPIVRPQNAKETALVGQIYLTSVSFA
jgi:hypothetical protein